MSEFIKPYNNDPSVGNLATPVTTSTVTKIYLGNLPLYRKGLSPLFRGLEIGMAHGYFLIGPFYLLGPLRNSENALLIGFLAALGLIVIFVVALVVIVGPFSCYIYLKSMLCQLAKLISTKHAQASLQTYCDYSDVVSKI